MLVLLLVLVTVSGSSAAGGVCARRYTYVPDMQVPLVSPAHCSPFLFSLSTFKDSAILGLHHH